MGAKKANGVLVCISNHTGQQDEGSDLGTLLNAGEAAPKVFWSVLGSYIKKDIEVLEQVQ